MIGLSDNKDYLDDINDYDSKLLNKLTTSKLSQVEKEDIGRIWSESRECGALCFYHWFDDYPLIASKEEAWKAFPNLQQLANKYYRDQEDYDDNGNPTSERYNYSFTNFEWSLFHIGDYYILEAYFSH